MTMNDKEREVYRILDNVVASTAIQIDEEGTMSITKEDVLGKNRTEAVTMTRCIFAAQMIHAGYSVGTIGKILHRSAPTIRHLLALDIQYIKTSRAYRIAMSQATLLNRDCEPTSY